MTTQRELLAPDVGDAWAAWLARADGRDEASLRARARWFASLPEATRDADLFELWALVQGLVAFGHPRNHPGARGAPPVGADFAPHVRHVHDGLVRVTELARALRDGDARDRSAAPVARDLVALRHALEHLNEVTRGVGGLDAVPFRLFFALTALVEREIDRSALAEPIESLAAIPELDRVPPGDVADSLSLVPTGDARRVVVRTVLVLHRLRRALVLTRALAADEDRRGLAWLVLATVRAESRALVSFLRERAAAEMARGFDAELWALTAPEIVIQRPSLAALSRRLLHLRGTLDTVAAGLSLESRRTFAHELPAPSEEDGEDAARRIVAASDELRGGVDSLLLLVARAIGATVAPASPSEARAASERLRRDIWMFAQVVRAFVAKAETAAPDDDAWTQGPRVAFVREFASYARAIGRPLLRGGDYPRIESFLALATSLAEAPRLEPWALSRALGEARAFHAFLLELFAQIGRRAELADVPFERATAAAVLRGYIAS